MLIDAYIKLYSFEHTIVNSNCREMHNVVIDKFGFDSLNKQRLTNNSCAFDLSFLTPSC